MQLVPSSSLGCGGGGGGATSDPATTSASVSAGGGGGGAAACGLVLLGKSTGKHGFDHEMWGFPLNFPVNQSHEIGSHIGYGSKFEIPMI